MLVQSKQKLNDHDGNHSGKFERKQSHLTLKEKGKLGKYFLTSMTGTRSIFLIYEEPLQISKQINILKENKWSTENGALVVGKRKRNTMSY